MQSRGEATGRRMSFPQDNHGHLFQRSRPRNLSIGSNNNIEEENRIIRAAVLGKDGVGKTAFTVRLLTRRFIGDYDGTLGKLKICNHYFSATN
ncbi:ras-like protein family member 11B [Orbicella faveolata]|uniref:ras-like protein family member 11B n=1 Tax=Orbicella faveolata TaxID=48498 RepID=UPI0009E532BA|nr:ras-like protein family member 11B [Orbicella faveolata]XP_020607864.1 ras-like protein family member 11B [Orbicella faveolata]XP_020614138.1 ras-like protein family member 11B [Orbicella faveolata]XP_020614139.1 ras-like protein family member 11B [Orbicella faveolata]XP_020614140.1 ras-like protein family member 11B [Orbicella faveolata]